MIQNFLYRITYGFLYLISLLPFWLMYLISDVLYGIIYYLWGYRRKVVRANLENAFPEKNSEEITRIEKDFYHHLCDMLVEILKGISLNARQIQKRIRVLNPEVLDSVRNGSRGALIIGSHYGNLEWVNAVVDIAAGDLPTYSIYQKLSSPLANRLILRIRGRFGTQLVEKKEAFRAAEKYLQQPGLMGFAIDQSPRRRPKRPHLYFTEFLGLPTAMHEGAAVLATGKNFASFFLDVQKIRRGYYTIRIEPIPVSITDVHAYTDYHVALLEPRIRQAPAYWLWTHRRWKHQPRDGDELSPLLTT